MSAEAGISVRIWYPYDPNPDDETWLAALASRHNGELSDRLLESFPPQRDAWFETRSDVHAFVAELTDSGRWRL